jgi:predicted RND superfamily exporter protein
LVLCNFGVMGLFGIKLNIATAMISSLTMGIGIDYTIHMLEGYKREGSLREVYATGGVAIITDALSTGVGFAVLLFSQFVLLAEFGVLVAFSLCLSAVVGLVLIPVLGRMK